MSLTLSPVVVVCMSCKLHWCSRTVHEFHNGPSIWHKADWNSSFPITHLSSSNSFWIFSLPGWSVTVTILIVYLSTSVACTLGTSKAPELQTSTIIFSCFWIILLLAIPVPSNFSFLVLLVKCVTVQPSPFSCCWSGFLWFFSLPTNLFFISTSLCAFTLIFCTHKMHSLHVQ